MPKEYACGNRIIWSIVTAISVAVIIGGGVYYGSAVDGVDNECASDQTCCTNTDYCTSGLDSDCPGSDTCNNEPDYWKFCEGPNTVCSPSVVTFIDTGDNSVNTEPCDFNCNTCTIINLSYYQPYYNACCKNTVPVCGTCVSVSPSESPTGSPTETTPVPSESPTAVPTPGASCSDGLMNGDETDADCGGPSCERCGIGEQCLSSDDCAGSVCSNGEEGAACVDTPAGWQDALGNGGCDDWKENSWCPEHGDLFFNSDGVSANEACCACGGGSFPGTCVSVSPSLSPTALPTLSPTESPTESTPVPSESPTAVPTPGASCSDELMNGDETDVDCGGPSCDRCGIGELCLSSDDCDGSVCSNGEEGAEYALVYSGTCQSNNRLDVPQADCETAAKFLGLDDTVIPETTPDYPPGCYLWNGGGVYFNREESSVVNCGNRNGCICGIDHSNSGTCVSVSPSESPTGSPTEAPIETLTETPTETPTSAPSESPTPSPTEMPTESPTESPIEAPTETPTETPTSAPSDSPTPSPTEAPTESPTETPTNSPTETPTDSPTESPTESPTTSPSALPTSAPSPNPTVSPTPPPTTAACNDALQNGDETDVDCGGSCLPCAIGQSCFFDSDCRQGLCASLSNVCVTFSPTTAPSPSPTGLPTEVPTASSTSTPSTSPSVMPSAVPTGVPTSEPSTSPTQQRKTSQPTTAPPMTAPPTTLPPTTLPPTTLPPTTLPPTTLPPTTLPTSAPSTAFMPVAVLSMLEIVGVDCDAYRNDAELQTHIISAIATAGEVSLDKIVLLSAREIGEDGVTTDCANAGLRRELQTRDIDGVSLAVDFRVSVLTADAADHAADSLMSNNESFGVLLQAYVQQNINDNARIVSPRNVTVEQGHAPENSGSEDHPSPKKSDALPVGIIAGIAVGVGLVAAGAFFVQKKKQMKPSQVKEQKKMDMKSIQMVGVEHNNAPRGSTPLPVSSPSVLDASEKRPGALQKLGGWTVPTFMSRERKSLALATVSDARQIEPDVESPWQLSNERLRGVMGPADANELPTTLDDIQLTPLELNRSRSSSVLSMGSLGVYRGRSSSTIDRRSRSSTIDRRRSDSSGSRCIPDPLETTDLPEEVELADLEEGKTSVIGV